MLFDCYYTTYEKVSYEIHSYEVQIMKDELKVRRIEDL